MFSKLIDRIRCHLLEYKAEWQSFDGTQEDFPIWHSVSGRPMEYQVLLENGERHYAHLVGGYGKTERFIYRETWGDIPANQIKAWRNVDPIFLTGWRRSVVEAIDENQRKRNYRIGLLA